MFSRCWRRRSQKVWILHQENLTDVLKAEEKRGPLSKSQLERTLQSIETHAGNAEKLWKRDQVMQA